MRDFIRRVCAFAALQLPILLVVWHQGRLDASDHFYRAMHDKLLRLEQPSERARLIFLGGSSLAFGLHSPLLRDALDMEPTNLGLDGSLLRNPFLLRECASKLREGDVVVLSYEHVVFTLHPPPDSRIFEFVQQVPSTKPHFLPDYADLLAGIPDPAPSAREFLDRDALRLVANGTRRARLKLFGYTPSLFKRYGHDSYTRQGFNRYGDFVRHYGEPSTIDPNQVPLLEASLSDESEIVAGLNWFAEHCEDKGVRVCFVWTPIALSYYERNRVMFTQLERRLAANLRVTQLTQGGEALYPLESLYDTGYHLREEEGASYTEFLIERLRPWLAETQRPPR